MKVFHINEFKCTLCSNWFCPPFNLPYRLKCTHSICTNCLEKSISNKTNQIICPEDMESNPISSITINHSTKKALERLLKQHKNFTQTNNFECIQSLSKNFDELLNSKQMELKNLLTLVEQIFENQFRRLKEIEEKVKLEINRPFRIVKDWKDVVQNYLKKVRSCGSNMKGCVNELNHYIEEGRKIKLDLNQYLKPDFRQLIDYLLVQPQVCFVHSFSIFDKTQSPSPKHQFASSLSKFQTLGKKIPSNNRQIIIHDDLNNFDQSSIRVNNLLHQPQQNSNKMSLFEELIHQTPKNQKNHQRSKIYDNCKKSPLKEINFSSQQNNSATPKLDEKNKSLNGSLKKSSLRNELGPTCISKYLEGNCEIDEKDYNEKIKQKIRYLKTKVQNNNFQQSANMVKSLEYSPEDIDYSPEALKNDILYEDSGSNLQIYPNFITKEHKITRPISYQQSSSSVKNFKQNNSRERNKSREEPGQIEEEMLLEQKSNRKYLNQKLKLKNDWQLENMNFLKEWKINKNTKPEEELEIVQRQGGYDCQKQKNRYAKKIEQNKVKQILSQIQLGDNFISLVGHSLADCNINLLLSQVNWSYCNIEIVKFIKTSLNDQQLNNLLNFLVRSNVHTLMLSYNNLSELSLDALLNFVEVNNKLKNVYLPKNNISLLKGNARAKLNLLKEKGINLYI